MEIKRVLVLRGPNIWSRRTVIEAWIDLQGLEDTPSTTIPGLYERLTAWLPGLEEHRCSIGTKGGFLQRLREGTYPAHILEHLTIELQNVAGTPVGFGKARETDVPGLYRVVVRYREEEVAIACLETARDMLLAAIRDEPFDISTTIARLKDIAQRSMLGPSTMAIVEAAESRDIPWTRMGKESLLVLGHGSKQRKAWTTETDRTGAIAESTAKDKDLARRMLRTCGVPVPYGRIVGSTAEAWEVAQQIGPPVVVKPVDGNHGRGVYLELFTREQVEAAFHGAQREGSAVVVERFIQGYEHRLLVVSGKLVAAAKGEPAYVIGNGQHTVRELVECQLNSDPLRGESDEYPLNPVEIDNTVLMELAKQGLTPDSIPDSGQKVLIQRNGNVAHDVTDLVHPEVAERAALAAKVVGLDIAGVDLVTTDISRPLEATDGAIVEVNAGPALHAHLKPATGQPRPVGQEIINALFPTEENGRIPLICVTGVHRRPVVAWLVFSALRQLGWRGVGLTSTNGIWLDERLLVAGDCADASGARRLLLHPRVNIAVIEATPESILKEGLGFDKCLISAVTEIEETSLDYPFVRGREDMFTVLRCPVDVTRTEGCAVLDAQDPLALEMIPLCAGEVILVSSDPEAVFTHCESGKRAVVKDHAQIRFIFDRSRQLTCDFPWTEDPMVDLETAAILWSLGSTPEIITSCLEKARILIRRRERVVRL